jgi:hypothetical protein
MHRLWTTLWSNSIPAAFYPDVPAPLLSDDQREHPEAGDANAGKPT